MAEKQTETHAGTTGRGVITEPPARNPERDRPIASTVAIVAAAAAAVALIEIDWLPGLLIGVGATLAPKAFPNLGRSMRPLIKGVVSASFTFAESARTALAEAREEMEDIIAEVRAEKPQASPSREGDSGEVVH